MKKKKVTEDKIVFDRKELLSILNKLRPALSKESNGEFSSFVFTGDYIVTNNDRISIFYPFKSKKKFLFPSNESISLLSKIDSEKISVSIQDQFIIISTTGTKSKLKYSGGKEEFDFLKKVTSDMDSKFKKLPKDFLNGLRLSAYTVSKDISDLSVSNVFVSGDRLCSTDNFRIGRYTLSKKIKDSFFISFDSLRELVKFNIKEYLLSDSRIFFKTEDGVIFSQALVDAERNEMDQYFDFKGEEIEFSENMSEVVNRAAVLSESNDGMERFVNISVEDGKVLCKGENERGWVKSTSEIDFDGSIDFAINPDFLLEALEKTNKIKIGSDRALFEFDNFEYLTILHGVEVEEED